METLRNIFEFIDIHGLTIFQSIAIIVVIIYLLPDRKFKQHEKEKE